MQAAFAVLLLTCGAAAKSLLAPEHTSSLVAPLKFDQRLLVCNAYASKMPMDVSKNSQAVGRSLGFKECSYLPLSILAKDKLDFTNKESGIQGTFEVGDLPDSDSVLLLVLQRRDSHSPLLAFQSFAFPMNTNSDEANVAVIDAAPGAKVAHIKVLDRPLNKQQQPQMEELAFNRIFALERGAYDLSVLEAQTGKEEVAVDKLTKTAVELQGSRNYVVIRMEDTKGAPSLVTFPHEDLPKSGAAPFVSLLGAAMAVAAQILLF